jgi:hypothetical protein
MSRQDHSGGSGVPGYQPRGGSKRGSDSRNGGGSSNSNNNSSSSSSSSSGSWQRSVAQSGRSQNRTRNTGQGKSYTGGNSNRTRGGGGGGVGSDRGTGTSSFTSASARAAVIKCLHNHNYRGGVKILVDAARTGVCTEEAENFDLLKILSEMVERNLYPEISKVVKVVWNSENNGNSNDSNNSDSSGSGNNLRSKILEAYAPKELVKKLMASHYHEEACRCLNDFKLKEDVQTTTYVMKMLLKSGQFDRVMKVSKSLNYPSGYEPNRLIQTMIDRGNVSTALKHINELKNLLIGGDNSSGNNKDDNCSGSTKTLIMLFNVEELINQLYTAGEYDNVLKYARRFNLTNIFPTKKIVNGMLDSRMWNHAMKTIASSGLKGDEFSVSLSSSSSSSSSSAAAAAAACFY